MATGIRWPAIALASLLAGACVASPPPVASAPSAPACHTASVTVSFDFEGASASRCVVEGERSFAILVSPEHAPPINPSAWYAFRYDATPGADVSFTLRYLDARHRYRPKRQKGDVWQLIDADVAEDGTSARFTVPAGSAVVAGQELFGSDRYDRTMDRLSASAHVQRMDLGRSLDDRPIEGLEIGDPAAPYLVVLLGRAHPPEVTGALAMEAFLDRVVELVDEGTIDPARFRFLAVPMLNPDGVARGHWRANLGGTDLNRDWGKFAQPETRAVKAWLDRQPPTTRPVAMIDFHSTQRDVFYTIPRDLPTVPAGFTERWLELIGDSVPEFSINIAPGHSNGSGVAKNWFYETWGIPAITFEIGDQTDRRLISKVGRRSADAFAQALGEATLPTPQ